jgi:multidrug efflux pump subunit AcrA (membrane-fusion protein)
VEIQLPEVRQAEQEKSLRLSQTEADLAATQKSEKEKTERLTQLESELAKIRQSDEAKTVRVSQVESELTLAKRSADENATRLKTLEADLVQAKRSAEEAKAVAGKLEAAQRPRIIAPEQRLAFLEAVHGQSRGKIIVSAIFFNKEAHDFGNQIVKLLNDSGFTLLEPTPMNFFTTARPPGGIRIGFKNESNEPAEVATLLKGFRAIDLDPPITTVVNSDADDVVEIQITPRE